MPKAGKVPTKLRAARRTPLHVELAADADPSRGIKRPAVKSVIGEDDTSDCEGDESVALVDHAISAKILKLATQQQEEDEKELESLHNPTLVEDDNVPEPAVDASGYVQIAVEPQDEDTAAFMGQRTTEGRRQLADLILAKLQEHENAATEGQAKDTSVTQDPRIAEMYTAIGAFLSKYRSGRLPKAFKIIPRLVNWEEILLLTDPINWTPNAMHEAVRIFASNLKPRMAQRFFNLVLLPAVRDDIEANKKLHFHHYQALKKAFFKPAAWFQGILFPTLLDGCSWREAVIFGSVLAKISIPPLHTAAALIRLSQLHKGDPAAWTPATSYIIKILLNKKTALPTSAVTAVFQHFQSFLVDTRQLPVGWHQALLTFVQRYKFEFTPAILRGLYDVLKVHCHHLIGPEIRRELQHAENTSWVRPAVQS